MIKRIMFFWNDEEHKAKAKFILPHDVVERFFQGETIEFTFQKEYGRVDIRQRRKSGGNQTIIGIESV